MKIIISKLKNALALITDCIGRVVPVILGVGMIKATLVLLGPSFFNLINESSPTFIALSFVADSGYYFLPIYTGFSSAEVFKTNKYFGAVIGGMLVAPKFVELVAANSSLSVFGLPIVNADYGNQILPSIIAVWIMSYIWKLLDKIIHPNFKSLLMPPLIMIIMTPIIFCAIGPVGYYLSSKIVDVVLLLKNIGPIGNGIMSLLIPYTTITGLSGGNLSAMLYFAASGVDPILFFSNVIYNCAQGFGALAVYLKNKNPDILAAAITSTVAGTGEPALYQVYIKNFKFMAALNIGCFVGGLYSGICAVKAYSMTSFGIFGLIATAGPESSMLHAAIAIAIACIITFALCFIFNRNEK